MRNSQTIMDFRRENEEKSVKLIIRVPAGRYQEHQVVGRFLAKTLADADLLDLQVSSQINEAQHRKTCSHDRAASPSPTVLNARPDSHSDPQASFFSSQLTQQPSFVSLERSSQFSSYSSDKIKQEHSFDVEMPEVEQMCGGTGENHTMKPLGSKVTCRDGSTYEVGSTVIHLNYDVVICGRGGHVNKVNNFLVKMIDQHCREAYRHCRTTAEKRRILQTVYEFVTHRGGRFLNKDGREVAPELALQKIRAIIVGRMRQHKCQPSTVKKENQLEDRVRSTISSFSSSSRNALKSVATSSKTEAWQIGESDSPFCDSTKQEVSEQDLFQGGAADDGAHPSSNWYKAKVDTEEEGSIVDFLGDLYAHVTTEERGEEAPSVFHL